MPAQANTPPVDGPNIDVNTPYTPKRPAPLVSISVNHPLATGIRKIKNFLTHKQTLFSTTLTIKITPIVAIVSVFGIVAIFGGGITTAYTFGKSVGEKFLAGALNTPTPTPAKTLISPTPTPAIVSKAGIVKSTYQIPSLIPTPPTGGSASTSAKPYPVLHYILVEKNNSYLFLKAQAGIKLQNYLNLRVLVTGTLDNKNTLTIMRPEDIEVLQ